MRNGPYNENDFMNDYTLDYGMGMFVLWNKRTKYEVDISEEEALKWSTNNGIRITEAAKNHLNSMGEDLEMLNEEYNK